MTKLTTVLLDLDGTLVDSNEYHTQAWVEVLAEFGYDVQYEDVRRLIGMGTDNFLPALLGWSKDDPRIETIGDRRAEIVRTKYMPKAQAFPQAHDLLVRMKREGLKLVPASSASKQEVEKLLKKVDADGLVESATSSDDAENSKPDPDIIQAALDKAKVKPENAIMLGDAPYDIEAAHKAGVRLIALRCGGFSDKDLVAADAIYDDPADLLARFDESPLAK